MTQPVVLAWGARTDAGRRAENQDEVLAAPPVFAVADGMGGHASGAAASGSAVARLAAVAALATVPRTTVAELRTAMQAADADIRALSEGVAAGAGTTVAGVALVDSGGEPYWTVFGLGDSRVYLWDGQVLTQLSADHSVVQELLDAGAITPDQAAQHPERHVITRALGVGPDCEADFSLLPVRTAQRFLVCSDGVSGALAPARLAAELAVAAHPQQVAVDLVEAAVAAGSTDNVSAVVVDVVAVPDGGSRTADADTAEATIPRLTPTLDHGADR